VSSVPGEGSIFTVLVPAERAADAPAAATELTAAEVARDLTDRPVRILAAEDNATNQRVLQALLAPLGVDLVLVGDGQGAVDAWRAEPFDLILMDIQMPGMGGVAASRAIRAEEARTGTRPIPIVALSANAMSHQVAEYLAAGMTGYVAKPIDIATLHAPSARRWRRPIPRKRGREPDRSIFPLIPAKAGTQVFYPRALAFPDVNQKSLGPRFRGDERVGSLRRLVHRP